MASPSTTPAPRFRRRIFGVGALATLILLVIGGPFFVNRIESDLEQRVPVELAAAGFGGITASFSGQDGTLSCAAPLDDPEQAIAEAYDVWGVRAIDLDRSCRVNRAPTVETTIPDPTDSDTGGSTTTMVAGDDTEPDETPATTVPPDFDTVAEIVRSTPQLSLLAVLLDEADMTDMFSNPTGEPVTLFAPSDDAFDALAADALAKLRADPEVLRRVLNFHAVDGALLVSDLTNGELTNLDGGELEIAVTGSEVSVSGAMIGDDDIAAVNGVVHVIDGVLLPPDIDVSVQGPFAATTAALDGGTITLTGVVASETERSVLVGAATAAPASLLVDDRLTIDPVSGLDPAMVGSLAQLVTAMSTNLVSGSVGFDGTAFAVSGTYLGEIDRDAMAVAAAVLDAAVDLQPVSAATDSEAGDLEAELNAYVSQNPIFFEPGSAVLASSSTTVLDRLAAEANQFVGVEIIVEGHTDSDGVPAENLTLSQYRALVVRQALIERGIPEDSITAQGFGSERPVLVDGVEDKSASRRVEFRVVASS
jgi:outer membrane protein OmpA-like peptidoglycan-associated protein/uncharacterized surface protein with fasciclin (FAS1) repeats